MIGEEKKHVYNIYIYVYIIYSYPNRSEYLYYWTVLLEAGI